LGQDKAFYQKIKIFIPKYVPLLRTYVCYLRTLAIDPPPTKKLQKSYNSNRKKDKKKTKKVIDKCGNGAIM